MNTINSRVKRSRFSLSIRGLLILVLILGGILGWKMRHVKIQRQAVAEIKRLGGEIQYDWEESKDPLAPNLGTNPRAPHWLRELVGDEFFQEVSEIQFKVYIHNREYSEFRRDLPEEIMLGPDAAEMRVLEIEDRKLKEALSRNQLACLDGLTHIKRLQLAPDVKLTSEGNARLGRISSLKDLTLFDPANLDALKAIGQLTNLETINLTVNQGADPDLAFLARLKDVQCININCIDLSDVGMFRLGQLKQLKELHVQSSRFSKVGLANLSKLKSLKELVIKGTIDEGGFVNWKSLKNLEHLELDSPNGITKSDILNIAKIRTLSTFCFNSRLLTETDLSAMKEFTNLRVLRLQDSNLGSDTLKDLQQAIPGLQFSP